MVIIHGKSKRKSTGGRFTDAKPKRLNQKGNHPAHTKIGAEHRKTVPTKGGGHKDKLFVVSKVNVYNPKSKAYSIEEIKSVTENPADRHFVRHNILTKGAVVTTASGKKARVTNRPGQEAIVNAVLLE